MVNRFKRERDALDRSTIPVLDVAASSNVGAALSSSGSTAR
jgi:hypothetical protein